MIELLDRIRKKDKNAVELLYTRYGKQLYGYAIRKWQLEEDAAWELVYKTLYKVMEVADKYRFESEQKFTGFLFRAFVNNLRNHYHEHKLKTLSTVTLEEQHEGGPQLNNHEESVAEPGSLRMRLLQEELQKLDDWKKIVLLMRAQNYTYEEIAAYVQRPADQLKVYYMRLKKQLTETINRRLSEMKE